MFARKLCGEGVPDFYIPDDVLEHKCTGFIAWFDKLFGTCKPLGDYHYKVDANGDPLITECQKVGFGAYYSTPEAMSAFNRLYENIDGLQDKFMFYWDKVSTAFANNPYVVGYDPLNEPPPSNVFSEPSLIYEPGKFDSTKLQPLYQRAYDVYQKNDKSKIMFFESAEFPDEIGAFGGLVFHLGFDAPIGG